LITFNESAASVSKLKRQANTPLSYNVTQAFAALAGALYTLSASASETDANGVPAACTISLCGGGSCRQTNSLTSAYQVYTYQFTAPNSDPAAEAIIGIQCPDSAYVALENITVATGGSTGGSSALSTTTVYQTITQNQTILSTEYITVQGTQYLNQTVSAFSTVTGESQGTK
jgi:hypothetical protein